MRGCPCSVLDSVGRCWRYCFRSSKAFYCTGPHSTFAEPLNILKKWRLLSASFAMNCSRLLYGLSTFAPLFCLRGLHLEDGPDFVEASFNAFGGDQYFASCYSKSTFV
jgi:hypothetical protein